MRFWTVKWIGQVNNNDLAAIRAYANQGAVEKWADRIRMQSFHQEAQRLRAFAQVVFHSSDCQVEEYNFSKEVFLRELCSRDGWEILKKLDFLAIYHLGELVKEPTFKGAITRICSEAK